MRRVISIFLLLIMLVIGAHPVLAMHFCEGKLFSVNMVDNPQSHSCCGNMSKMSEEDCDSSKQAFNDRFSSFSAKKDGCCDFRQVRLSTDDFNNNQQQLNLNNVQPSFDNVWFILYSVLNYSGPDYSSTTQHIFPPGGLDKLNTDLLTYICIYRI